MFGWFKNDHGPYLRDNSDLLIKAVENQRAREVAELRDRFAMAALTGILASPEHVSDVEIITGSAYQWADAMMKARDQ